LFALFSVFTARRGASSRRYVVTLNLCGFDTGRGNSRIWIVHGTSKSICACPTRPVRAQIPAIFRKYYKTAGITPLILRIYIVSISTSTAIAIWVKRSGTAYAVLSDVIKIKPAFKKRALKTIFLFFTNRINSFYYSKNIRQNKFCNDLEHMFQYLVYSSHFDILIHYCMTDSFL